MIYRKWSLLTGPTSLIAGVIGTVVVADLIFVDNGWLRKGDEKKQKPATSSK